MRKATKITLIIAGVLTIVGIALSVSGIAMTGFQWEQLSTSPPYQDTESTYNATTIKHISIQNTNQRIIWKRSTDNKIHLTCPENKYEFYQVSQPDSETLKIEFISQKAWYHYLFNLNFDYPRLVIEVPEQFQGSAEITSTSGDILLSDSTISSDLSISTKSGYVLVDNTQISSSLRIQSSSGDTCINQTKLSGNLSMESTSGNVWVKKTDIGVGATITSTSGDIILESVSADQYHLQATSGNILATLNGSSLDYTISANSKSGNISIPPSGEEKNPIQVSTSSGDIAIYFHF